MIKSKSKKRGQMLYNDFLKTPNIFYFLFAIVLLWLLILSFFLIHYILHYRKLVKKTGKKNLKSVLDEILRTVQVNQKDLLDLEKKYLKLDKNQAKFLQKIGFLRFNPFSDTGGDQSFILSILDDRGNGMILSSLHSRGTTRLYAKQVIKGKSKVFKLSKEEQGVVQKLLKKTK